MQGLGFRRSSWLLALVALLAFSAGTAQAQLQTGDLFGTVTDNQGEPLPGVTVTLSGIGAPRVTITNAEGQFRFLGLSPGDYQLVVALEGFSTVEYPNINIRVGRTTTVEVTLSPAIEETITVTSASPLLDERKLVTGATINSLELEKLPTARDPWSILNQAPGVQIDRNNVGGNESGQQSVFTGPGADSGQNVFAVDGVVITDMDAIGASPTYYDFDAFEEVQLSTGGVDIANATPGVTVNLVTKRGGNQLSGSARYFNTDESLQSNSGFDTGRLPAEQDGFQANEINAIEEKGFEIGGPIWRDHLWFWGAYGEQNIRNIVASGARDDTILENSNIKLNAQASQNNSAVFQFSRGDKIKSGRGAGNTRPPETTWDQSGPTEVWKFEDTHIFSSDLYLTGLWSYVDGGFGLISKGRADQVLNSGGVWGRTYLDFGSDRDVDQYRVDGSYFFNTSNMAHELKFGTSLREADTGTGTTWGDENVIVFEDGATTAGRDQRARVYRAALPAFKDTTEYTSIWAQDTITRDNLTINVGLRYDKQTGDNPPFTLAGNDLLPDLLPDLDFQGNDADGIEFTDISPRIGVTYALGPERKTLLRASYSRFVQQLQQGLIFRTNPLDSAFAIIDFTDANGNLEFDPGEDYDFLNAIGFDPANPTALASPNRNDPGLEAEKTDEINLSIEHAFRPELVGGFTITHRIVSDLHERAYLVRDASGNVRPAGEGDFVFDGTLSGPVPGGGTYSIPTYALSPAVDFTGGYLLRNGDREQSYTGYTATLTKRLSNQWMMRGQFTYYDWKWDIPGSYFFDANDLAPGQRPETSIDEWKDFDNDGAPVAQQSDGSGDKEDVLLNSRWSFNINGMYQVAPNEPWGFNVAANISGREGFPRPYYLGNANVSTSDNLPRDLQVTSTGGERNEELFLVDLRIDKEFNYSDFRLTVSADVFNLFNDDTILQRERDLGGSNAFFVDEVVSPRVIRLGLRLNFR